MYREGKRKVWEVVSRRKCPGETHKPKLAIVDKSKLNVKQVISWVHISSWCMYKEVQVGTEYSNFLIYVKGFCDVKIGCS